MHRVPYQTKSPGTNQRRAAVLPTYLSVYLLSSMPIQTEGARRHRKISIPSTQSESIFFALYGSNPANALQDIELRPLPGLSSPGSVYWVG